LFALKNQLPITGETVYKMDGFLSESKSILSNMDIIMNELISAEKSPATDEILRIFTGEEGFSTSENAQLKPEISANILTEGSEAQPAISAEGAASQTAQNAKTLPTDNLSQAQRQELLKLAEEFLVGGEKPDREAFFSKLNMLSEKGEFATREQAVKFIGESFENRPEILRQLNGNFERSVSEENNTAAKVENIFRKFKLNPEENNIEKLEQTLNEIKQKAGEAVKLMESMNSKLPDSLAKALKDLNNNLEFINQLRTCVYVPIPLNTPSGPAEGELYVFKDKRSKGKGGPAGSALIGLNTLNLGRVEAYMQKRENKLNLQFRLENMDINKVINSHAKTLMNLLDGAGLKLTSLSIIPLDAAFDILRKEPSAKEVSYDLGEKTFDTRA